MSVWWYAEKDKKTGPLEAEQLKQLLQSGKIEPRTMLWREGMDAWRPLAEIDELQMITAAVPPPLPSKTSSDPLTFPLATSWPRFFARIFDVWWEILFVSFVLGTVLGRYSAGFVEWINGPGASQLFGILCLPIGLILDAAVYRIIGNTPGKVLLGLKAGTLDGKALSFGKYLGRNFSMWARGLALGFPLINLFTMAHQSGRLGKGQQASYDANKHGVKSCVISGNNPSYEKLKFEAKPLSYHSSLNDRNAGIEAAYQTGNYTVEVVADEFGLDYTTASRIAKKPGCNVLSKDLTPIYSLLAMDCR